ncbi:hypothetical protein D3C87_1234200 [compost metagenome]
MQGQAQGNSVEIATGRQKKRETGAGACQKRVRCGRAVWVEKGSRKIDTVAVARRLGPVITQRDDGRAGGRSLQPGERNWIDDGVFGDAWRKRLWCLASIGCGNSAQQNLRREGFTKQAMHQKRQQYLSFAQEHDGLKRRIDFRVERACLKVVQKGHRFVFRCGLKQLHERCRRGLYALGKGAVFSKGKPHAQFGPCLANRLQCRCQPQKVALAADAVGENMPEDLIGVLKLLEPDPLLILAWLRSAPWGFVRIVEGLFDAARKHARIICCHCPLLGSIMLR